VDRAREERALEDSIQDLVRAGTISVEEGARLLEGARAGATLPEIIDPRRNLGRLGPRECDGPDDHRLMRRDDPRMCATVYCCSRCGRSYAVADTVAASYRGDIGQMVREALS
jgi:hypothetical protein